MMEQKPIAYPKLRLLDSLKTPKTKHFLSQKKTYYQIRRKKTRRVPITEF